MADADRVAGTIPDELGLAWAALLELLGGLGPMTVAFSGGIDSRFLAHAAVRAGMSPALVHVRGPHVPPAETAYALDWAAGQGLGVRVLDLDPLALDEVAAGGRERCYACKSHLFREILGVAEGVLCDGSNASDLGQHRPGLRALRELGVLSPLAAAGLGKADIRVLARATGLDWPGQPSMACLLTRLPYGMPPDPEELRRLAGGEEAVRQALRLAGCGDVSFRLRVQENRGAELHVGLESLAPELRELLEAALREAGFAFSPIRCMPSISGYFDRMKSS